MQEPSGRTTQIQNLLDRLLQGDESARKELHEYTYRRFRTLTSTMLRDDGVRQDEKTDDVWHTTWIKIEQAVAIREFVSARHFLNSVAEIIRHSIVDIGRSRSGPKGRLVRSGLDREIAYDPVDPFAHEDAHKAVDSLPDEEREIVDLHIYAGLSLVEIAESQGTPVTTVKGRWQRACKKLRQVLKDRDPGS
jgi:RNA polymerase sigma-70 factor (ECF subfamily)